MKSALVGSPISQFHGLRTKCCRRSTRTGQAIYWQLTKGPKNASWRERVFVLHVACMAEMVAAAPQGAPARPAEIAAEIVALREAAAA